MRDFPVSLITPQLPLIGLIHGTIGILLFRFRNTNRDNINVVTLATCGLFLTELVLLHVNETAGLVMWGVAGVSLLVAYGQRFARRNDKQAIDILKLAAIVLLVFYPSNFYTLNWYLNGWDSLIVCGYLIVPVTGTIYFYDRWILKPQQMKRTFIAVLITQTILILTALTYGFYKDTLLEHTRDSAVEEQRKAQEAVTNLETELENCRQR